MQQEVRFHRNIRLRRDAYIGRQFYFVTLCCENRHRAFRSARGCQWLLESFCENCVAGYFAIHAHCVMPDHFHFLAEGLTPSSDLLALVKSFKIKTSRTYLRETQQILW